MSQNLALIRVSCVECTSFTYCIFQLKNYAYILITKWLKGHLAYYWWHTTVLENCLIIHGTYKNDSPFPLLCCSCKERAKKKAKWPEGKLGKFVKIFWEKKTFGKYSSLNNQDLPTYLHKIYCKIWLTDTYYFKLLQC